MRHLFSHCGLLCLLWALSCGTSAKAASNSAPSTIEQTPVFENGEGGYHTYRIPSVIRAQNGTLLAFCEGRKSGRGDSGNIDLVLKTSSDGGRSWGELQVLWDDASNTCGNPCPVIDRASGRILLLLTHNHGEDSEAEIKLRTGRGTRTVWMMHSDNHGKTWSRPRDITNAAKDPKWDWYATGPGIGIQVETGPHAGRLVIPCDHSYRDPNGTRKDVQSEYGAHVIFSDDRGETWQRSEPIVPKMNECQVAELKSPAGSLVLDMRSYRGKNCRAQSTSSDGGLSWTQQVDVPTLVEPVCQASLLRFGSVTEKASVLLFSNPADPKQRVRLTVRGSSDDGKSWSDGVVVHSGPSAYSCLVQLSDDLVGCLYEKGERSAYEEISFARLPLELTLQN